MEPLARHRTRELGLGADEGEELTVCCILMNIHCDQVQGILYWTYHKSAASALGSVWTMAKNAVMASKLTSRSELVQQLMKQRVGSIGDVA